MTITEPTRYSAGAKAGLVETYGRERPSDVELPADAPLTAMSWLLVGPDEPPKTPTGDHDMR